ncbi:SMI1/KNR4 family protein [Marinicella gelatinilytica]|uniref:SMI1/KNR4 family protein n=1 Tax=Marinicella gelatinilytica TaxID=2996017 RepID=UPI002260E23C|nr:SMI1/KNR4 family protein [Marinicella gelatinilytica]MCX7546033.1 SMI1/KNR4 family protein [Marinicella gelatinilytica]
MKEVEKLIHDNIEVPFLCEVAGEDSGELIVNTKTEILEPASSSTINAMEDKLGKFSVEFTTFYKKFGGISFHEQPEAFAASLYIHPYEKWEKLYGELMDWFDLIDEDELENSGIDWINNCVVFAEIPSSGNYFVMPLTGSNAGKIIYQDHDGLESNVYAESFFEFLTKFLSAPVAEIEYFGCYTRYSDGKTDKQWIPVKIV